MGVKSRKKLIPFSLRKRKDIVEQNPNTSDDRPAIILIPYSRDTLSLPRLKETDDLASVWAMADHEE
jgi:hypothetical protein